MAALAAGTRYASPLRGGLASARSRGRIGAGDHAGPGWNCLCGGVRRSRHIRPLRHDHSAGGLCAVRPQPHSGPRAGLVARGRHPERDPSVIRRRPCARRAACGHAGDCWGTVCILAGVARLGFVTELISKPIRYGYMNGIALTVLISQIPALFGFSIEDTGPLRDLWAIAGAIMQGRTNWTALVLGAATLAVILLLRGSKRVPGILIAVVGATAIVVALDLAARHGVAVLGPLPQGLPGFVVPWISYADIGPVLIGGCAIALVSFADTSVLSRAYAGRTGTHVDPNQEMVRLGAANFAAGFFQGFPISSSSSRTPVAEAAGARTQLTSVVAALIIAFLLLTAPNLLQNLPKTALAAVVIASAIGLIEVTDLKRIYRIQRWEFWLSIVCLVGVAVLGAVPGIGLAIAVAIIQFLWDGWRPHS